MPEALITTDVDQFLELIKNEGKISLQDVATRLGVSLETVQAWTDFLVEEHIVGVEYKFTTPFVFLEKEHLHKTAAFDIAIDTKEVFYEKARKRGLTPAQIRQLWLKYLATYHDALHEAFYAKAQERKIPYNKIQGLWEKYYAHLNEE